MARRCPACGTSYADEVAFCGADGTVTVHLPEPGEEPDARLGKHFGSYVVVARFADGAMGRVYEGRHVDTKAKVAIKILHDDVARDTVAVERFKREYESAQSMPHANIVGVIDFGETGDGSWYMTMEFLDGEELSQLLRREGGVPHPRLVRILAQVALALDHAHSFGVIHRDLKPDNIFLCATPEGDIAKVLDFGSVKLQLETGPKLTAFGTTLGSPYYMSPEQAMGKFDVDQRTDVFALGAILYEMLTGKVAFEGDNVAAIIMKIMSAQPAPPTQVKPGMPPALDDVVEKAVRKDKTRRYEGTRALAEAAIKAWGLTGTVEELASRPVADIAASMGVAVPPPPRPFGVQTAPPPTSAAARAAGGPAIPRAAPTPRVSRESLDGAGGSVVPLASKKNNQLLLLGAIGGMALLTLCGCGILAYFLR